MSFNPVTPKKPKSNHVFRAFKFTKEEYEFLRESAKKAKVSMTELVKQSVKFAMENFNKN